ncbi:hypothetical protein ACOSQ3_031462 [Xanthoceras sorbifolium]
MGDVGDAIMHAKALGSIKETSLVGVSSILTSEKEPMKETGESEAGLTTRVVEGSVKSWGKRVGTILPLFEESVDKKEKMSLLSGRCCRQSPLVPAVASSLRHIELQLLLLPHRNYCFLVAPLSMAAAIASSPVAATAVCFLPTPYRIAATVSRCNLLLLASFLAAASSPIVVVEKSNPL